MSDHIRLSVVVPCYNEEEGIAELHRRLSTACAGFEPYEVVMINDGSRDGTWGALQSMCKQDPHLVAVSLSRNHGHQIALSAGLSIARGERLFILDADLQDPPELLDKMMTVLDRGVDVAYGQRRTRPGDSPAKRVACAVFYRLLSRLADVDIPLDTGDFRLITRRVTDIINAMPERHRFVRGMIGWIGFRQEPVYYDRDARFAGTTKYPLRKLIRLALDGVTGFSVKPLRLAAYVGVFVALFGFGLIVYSLLSWIRGNTPGGWVSLMAAIAILGSMQLIMLGIFGEYLGRLYEQSKGRPLFSVDVVIRSR